MWSKEAHDLLERARNEIPVKWYESQDTAINLYFLISLGLLFTVNMRPLPIHIATASLCILSSLAERYTIIQGNKLNNKAIQRDLGPLILRQSSTSETIDPTVNTSVDKSYLMGDAKDVALSALIPAFGIGNVIAKTMSSMNNIRNLRRARRALEIHQAENRT